MCTGLFNILLVTRVFDKFRYFPNRQISIARELNFLRSNFVRARRLNTVSYSKIQILNCFPFLYGVSRFKFVLNFRSVLNLTKTIICLSTLIYSWAKFLFFILTYKFDVFTINPCVMWSAALRLTVRSNATRRACISGIERGSSRETKRDGQKKKKKKRNGPLVNIFFFFVRVRAQSAAKPVECFHYRYSRSIRRGVGKK